MKKLFVALLALALIGGAAFAEGPAVSGSASLSWGIDLDTGSTGFANAGSFSIDIPILAADKYGVGGEGMYGEIAITDIALTQTIDMTPASSWAFGDDFAFAATLYFSPFSLSVWEAPSLDINANDAIDDAGGLGAVVDAGTTLTYTSDAFSIAVKVLSDGDWTSNSSNTYAVGSSFSVALGELTTIAIDAALNPIGFDFQVGVSAPLSLAVAKGLTITPGLDVGMVDAAFGMDAGVATELLLSDANDDDESTNVTFNASWCANSDIEIALAFAEPLAGGFVDNLSLSAGVNVNELIKALAWDLNVGAGYNLVIDEKDSLLAEVAFTTNSDSVNTLNATVTFTNTMVANTDLTVTYTSGNLLGDPAVLGTLICAATISF